MQFVTWLDGFKKLDKLIQGAKKEEKPMNGDDDEKAYLH